MVEWKIKGLYKADAEAVYSEITALGDYFSPQDIVEKARDESTELHKCFEWDDTVAAQKYREHQARMLVASIVVRAETKKHEPVSVRVISSTPKKNQYRATRDLIRIEADYADLLARAKNELEAFQRKYRGLKELERIFAEIDNL